MSCRAAPVGPSLHPRVTHPDTQRGERGGASLTHSGAVAAGRCNVAETDPEVHAAGTKTRLTGPGHTPTLPTPAPAPAPNWVDSGELNPGGSPPPSPRTPPHQTEWPLAQLGCSRSMLLGRIETSWETWRTGLALGKGESRAQET